MSYNVQYLSKCVSLRYVVAISRITVLYIPPYHSNAALNWLQNSLCPSGSSVHST